MRRIYSNGPDKDYVINPFNRLISGSNRLCVAAPYVTKTDELAQAAHTGKSIDLLVGLNPSTSPEALSAVHGLPNLKIRYLTRRFHAKIYIADQAALVGSSNLTNGGLMSNREATIWLDRDEDTDAIDELRMLFVELWESARVLTAEKLKDFRQAIHSLPRMGPDPETLIENAIGIAEPVNINVASTKKTPERIFLDDLQRQVNEQYRPAFEEVTTLLRQNDFRRGELADVGIANETNRFLNWVRLTYAPGDEAWQTAPLRSQEERRSEIMRLGQEWSTTNEDKIPKDYVDWLHQVQTVFGAPAAIEATSKETLTQGLLSLHAFSEQIRFVKGGTAALPGAFWAANNDDLAKVKRTLNYLIHGPGDFIERLHDTLYDTRRKLGMFGKFCSLELYGTIKPEECPPMNGRMAKALRYLGFDVRGA